VAASRRSLLQWTKQHPIYAALFGTIGLIMAVSLFWGEKPVSQPVKKKTQAVMPDVGVKSALASKDIQENQRFIGETGEQVKDLAKQLKVLETKLSADTEARKQERLEEKQAKDALLQQLKAMAEKQGKTPKPAVQHAAPRQSTAKPDRVPQQAMSVPQQDEAAGHGKCRVGALCAFDVPQPKDLFRPPRPAALEQTPYLPKLAYARVRVVGGLMAKAQEGEGYPALLSVIGSFYGPMQLHGPGTRPTLTEVPMQGCLVLGKAKADLSMGRVRTDVVDLSCVMPDGHAFEPEIKGYVLGDDGTFGFPGTTIKNGSAVEYKAMLSAILQEVSGAIQAARSTVLVTGTGGIQPGQGIQNGLNQMVQFYLSQTYQLQPVIAVPSLTEGTLILQQGLELEGYPTEMLISRGDR
jgi:hypothetical protein